MNVSMNRFQDQYCSSPFYLAWAMLAQVENNLHQPLPSCHIMSCVLLSKLMLVPCQIPLQCPIYIAGVTIIVCHVCYSGHTTLKFTLRCTELLWSATTNNHQQQFAANHARFARVDHQQGEGIPRKANAVCFCAFLVPGCPPMGLTWAQQRIHTQHHSPLPAFA